MRILVSNDDGIHAPGIQCLANCLREVAEVRVVAPDRDRSGASNSLTLVRPVRAREVGGDGIQVDGTPTDCVHLALTGLLGDWEPDVVISGINSGANMGDDVLYSGTVAAAMEGRFLGLPAIAVSLVGIDLEHYDAAGRIVLDLLDRIHRVPLPAATILNVNVPDLPRERIRGVQATRLGNRHRAEPMIADADPRGRPIYWVGPAGSEQDAGPGTDFHAVREGYVSVTPIQVDLTRYDAIDTVGRWLEDGAPGSHHGS
ncbi:MULTISPECIES: 5'/3'-nucleotidase SurE [unclassified Thioalkalivibrio]|uniref:5'/3'-nucleotidase SurE n=1 Tax=unclassified Thioalkalivibrio TaxID=2621013 RepID=UPI00036E0084|nr:MULTISPECIES: 5'/3'-nucleotidase SurE [unclassified Thioalkalivibrio]